MSDLAAETTRQTGTQVTYTDMPAPEYVKMLVAAGLPQPLADAIADNSAGAAREGWYTGSQDLQQLLGRPSTPISEAIAEALRKHQHSQA